MNYPAVADGVSQKEEYSLIPSQAAGNMAQKKFKM